MASITLDRVSKTFPGGIHAVRDATLSFRDGEFVVLVGPSGCGKSTLLRMVAGLESVTSGTVSIGGRAVNDVPPKDRDVAMVFQNYALYPHMTVRRNMAFGLLRRRRHSGLGALLLRRAERRAELDAIDRKVEATARGLGIEGLLDRLPRELSGGQRQRVALGRALVRDPQVFLFDEPLSNLDARLRVEMRAELRELHRRTCATMVYVTHDQEEAMTLADRMVVMRAGEVQQCGTPADCYGRPANRFVAGFVGTPVMNFIEGRAGRGSFDSRDLSVPLAPDGWPHLEEGPAVLGIRPDRMRVGGAAASMPGAVPAVVRAVERLGDRTDLALAVGGTRLVARTEGDPGIAEGATVPVAVDASAVHLFSADEAGKRIARAGEPG